VGSLKLKRKRLTEPLKIPSVAVSPSSECSKSACSPRQIPKNGRSAAIQSRIMLSNPVNSSKRMCLLCALPRKNQGIGVGNLTGIRNEKSIRSNMLPSTYNTAQVSHTVVNYSESRLGYSGIFSHREKSMLTKYKISCKPTRFSTRQIHSSFTKAPHSLLPVKSLTEIHQAFSIIMRRKG